LCSCCSYYYYSFELRRQNNYSIATTKRHLEPTQNHAADEQGSAAPTRTYLLSGDRIISLTGYFDFIVPRGTRGPGQKKGAGDFAG
jgi:hypothetical protein